MINDSYLLSTILAKGYKQLKDPIMLSSGNWSYEYINLKHAFSTGVDLQILCEEIIAHTDSHFDAVGGLTMGADQFAHGIAALYGHNWFTVRKQPKRHGTSQLIEGAKPSHEDHILLIDDVVTSGKSILSAYHTVASTGAQTALAMSIVDRGELAAQAFQDLGVHYVSLFNYQDLDMSPVG